MGLLLGKGFSFRADRRGLGLKTYQSSVLYSSNANNPDELPNQQRLAWPWSRLWQSGAAAGGDEMQNDEKIRNPAPRLWKGSVK